MVGNQIMKGERELQNHMEDLMLLIMVLLAHLGDMNNQE